MRESVLANGNGNLCHYLGTLFIFCFFLHCATGVALFLGRVDATICCRNCENTIATRRTAICLCCIWSLDVVWSARMSNRAPYHTRPEKKVYFVFLREFSNYVAKTVMTNKEILWHDIPGYNTILKAFLIELKTRSFPKYTQSLLEASLAVIKNEKLTSILVTMLFGKTK